MEPKAFHSGKNSRRFAYPGPRPFTYPEMVIEIIARGGPLFTPGSLEKTTKQLRLTGGSAAKESSFYSDDYPQGGLR